MAGGYQGGVPDPADTSAPAGSEPTFGSYDDLNEYGVAPALADFTIIWERRAPEPMMTSGKEPGSLVPAMESDATGTRPRMKDMNVQRTYAESVRALYGLQPEQLGQLQLRLAAGGFFGENPSYVPNVPERKTFSVWDNVLKTAMRTGKTPDEVIDEAVEANGGLDEGLKKRGIGDSLNKPKSVLVTHPDDIRRIAKEISTKTLGRGWNNEQLDKFVQAYQAMDQASGEAEGTRAAPPSVEAAAEAAARRDNPLQAQAMDANNVMAMVIKSFANLGGAGGGQ